MVEGLNVSVPRSSVVRLELYEIYCLLCLLHVLPLTLLELLMNKDSYQACNQVMSEASYHP